MRITLILLFALLNCHGAIFAPARNNSQLSVDSHYEIDSITNVITICFWFGRDAASSGAFTGWIVGKGAGGQYGIKQDNGAATIDWDIDSHTGAEALWRTTSSVTTTNKTQFFALTFTYPDTNSIKLYIDGVSFSGTWINLPTNAAGVSNNIAFNIGAASIASSRATGYYSDCALWGSILTFSQLELIRKSHVKGMVKQLSPSALRLYMPLDGFAAGLVADSRTVFPDRGPFVPFSGYQPNPGSGGNVTGMPERICSYPPNE